MSSTWPILMSNNWTAEKSVQVFLLVGYGLVNLGAYRVREALLESERAPASDLSKQGEHTFIDI